MKRTLRNVGRALLAVLPVAALLVLHAPAATATPVIDYSNCESGDSKLVCYTWYSNTVGSVSVTWNFYEGGLYRFSRYGDTTGIVGCQRNRMYTYYLYVTDSTGTAQSWGNIYCNPYDWP